MLQRTAAGPRRDAPAVSVSRLGVGGVGALCGEEREGLHPWGERWAAWRWAPGGGRCSSILQDRKQHLPRESCTLATHHTDTPWKGDVVTGVAALPPTAWQKYWGPQASGVGGCLLGGRRADHEGDRASCVSSGGGGGRGQSRWSRGGGGRARAVACVSVCGVGDMWVTQALRARPSARAPSQWPPSVLFLVVSSPLFTH